jgi:hypothetical protein
LHADRVADRYVRQVEAGAIDFQRVGAHDAADGLHDAREHPGRLAH